MKVTVGLPVIHPISRWIVLSLVPTASKSLFHLDALGAITQQPLQPVGKPSFDEASQYVSPYRDIA
jgi:hypothetical protein